MKSKQLITLVGVLVLLSAGVVFKQAQKPAELTTEVYSSLDLSFSDALVAEISLSQGNSSERIMIKKIDDQWRLPDLSNSRADENKIKKLLDAIDDAKGEVRGNSKAIWSDFGIEDDEGIKISLMDRNAKELLALVLGVKKVGRSASFLRQKGDEKVYLVEPNLFSSIGIFGDPAQKGPELRFWNSLEFIPVAADEVSGIEIVKFQNLKEILMTGLKKSGGEWEFGESVSFPFKLDQSRVKNFLTNASKWRAEKVLSANDQDYGFVDPYLKLKFYLPRNEVFELMLSNPSGDEYFAQISNEEAIYQIPKYRIANLERDNSYFFANNPLDIDPDKVERLFVKISKKKKYEVRPKQKTWPDLTQYLSEFKNFRISRLLSNPSEINRAEGGPLLEVQEEGEDLKVIQFGKLLSEEKKEYAARLGDGQPFAVPDYVYNKFFENLDRLEDPADK